MENLEDKYKKFLKKIQKDFDLRTQNEAANKVIDNWFLFDPFFVEFAYSLVNPNTNKKSN